VRRTVISDILFVRMAVFVFAYYKGTVPDFKYGKDKEGKWKKFNMKIKAK